MMNGEKTTVISRFVRHGEENALISTILWHMVKINDVVSGFYDVKQDAVVSWICDTVRRIIVI